MSQKFPGGFVTKSPVAPTTTAASGIWTLDQQEQYQKAGTWPSPPPPPYIEDVFSTYLYTGNGSTQTITNGIDLSTKGGLVWIKNRTNAASHVLWDTARGAGTTSSGTNTHALSSNLTDAEGSLGGTTEYLNSFSTSGFSVTGNIYPYNANGSGINFASWTFRKQPKFFDVVTFTGPGVFNHSLGSVPGCVIIKSTSGTGTWFVAHRGANGYSRLNDTLANSGTGTPGIATSGSWCNCTSTTFDSSNFSSAGVSYVAYLFAHNAGGFGATETENVISCGSFTSSSIGLATVDLGYEPQWILYKGSNGVTNWQMVDNMRGFVVGAANAGTSYLNANTSGAEATTPPVGITNTGFNFDGAANITYIYIAIRRGPMKVPTDATKVFNPETHASPGNTGSSTITTGFPIDLNLIGVANTSAYYKFWATDRLRVNNATSTSNSLLTIFTDSETQYNGYATFNFANNTGYTITDTNGSWNGVTAGTDTVVSWNFRRAPSFFDEVCYTGGSGAQTVPHNLGVAPELIIIKSRSLTGTTPGWPVYTASGGVTKYLSLNTTDAQTTFAPFWGGTAPTSTNFYLGGYAATNNTGDTYVAYLFATCAGVSKVGSYTGTGATQTISCGFTGGARFVLIKRTDSTGDWYVWDTARGMVSGTDPYLFLNNEIAQVNANNVYTTTGGFQIVSTAAGINASGGNYIYLAIA